MRVKGVNVTDTGVWTCHVRVEGVNVTVPGSRVSNILIGEEVVEINLSVVSKQTSFFCLLFVVLY